MTRKKTLASLKIDGANIKSSIEAKKDLIKEQ